MRAKFFLGAILALALIGWSRPAAAVTIIDLGTLGGPRSAASAVNNGGQVAGSSELKVPGEHAFFWSAGKMMDIHAPDPDLVSFGFDINNNGQVVGQTYNTISGEIHAFSYQGGTTTDLGKLGGNSATAHGVNNPGQIVGTVDTSPFSQGFLWDAGSVTYLGTMPGYNSSYAYGINDQKQIAGIVSTGSTSRGVLWDNGVFTDLGTLGGTVSNAEAINNSTQIVGNSTNIVGQTHAFFWENGSMFDLGTLYGGSSSEASDINNNGAIVGYSTANLGSGNQNFAFLYSGGVMIDLNTLLPAKSGWTLQSAGGINDHNQIVGVGMHNGQRRAFLMTLPVPEPSSLLLGLLGGATVCAVGVRARRRRMK
jgi:probable HAF family extracellular repeat protein